jgi:hypothetical protein
VQKLLRAIDLITDAVACAQTGNAFACLAAVSEASKLLNEWRAEQAIESGAQAISKFEDEEPFFWDRNPC